MSGQGFFEGGLPGETYAQGLRRRGRTMATILALMLTGILVTYGAYSIVHSVWAVVAVATACGIVASRVDIRFDPPPGDAPASSDKIRWLLWVAPLVVLLGGVAIYTALRAREDFDVFQSGLLAALFGWVLGFTLIIIGDGFARARVRE